MKGRETKPAWVLACALLVLGGSDARAWVEVVPVPQRFPVVQDQLGYRWQLTGAGSFYSTGNNVFQSANQLFVNAVRFQPGNAFHAAPDRFRFEEERSGLRIRRDVWIDLQRSAVRHAEYVTNRSEVEQEVVCEVQSDFGFAWRELLAGQGRLVVRQGRRPRTGVFLNFNPAEGETDLFLLFGDGKGAVSPEVIRSGGDKRLTVRFAARVQPGETLGLAYWIGQRRWSGSEGGAPVLEPFWARGRLRDVRIEDGPVWNFSAAAQANREMRSAQLTQLNRFLDSLRIEPGPGYQSVSPGGIEVVEAPAGRLPLVTEFGEVELPWEEVAALRYGPRGRVYLRNGERWNVDGLEGVVDLEALIAPAGPGRGIGPGDAVLELRSGTVLTGRLNEGQSWKAHTALGAVSLGPRDVLEWDATVGQLTLRDGSRLRMVAGADQHLGIDHVRFGEVRFDLAEVERWQVDGEAGPERARLRFRQGDRLAAVPAGESLAIVTGNGLREVPFQQLRFLRRDSSLWHIEMKDGEMLTGALRETSLNWNWMGGIYPVVVEWMESYEAELE